MIQNLLESNHDDYLAFTKDKNAWTHSQYDQKAIELSIYADTILIDADVIFTNLKTFSIRARKLMVGQRKSKENLALTFQVTSKAKSDSWSSGTAPKPDLGNDGNNGENGANGFSATEIRIEVGCITGYFKLRTLKDWGGSGITGQKIMGQLARYSLKHSIYFYFGHYGQGITGHPKAAN